MPKIVYPGTRKIRQANTALRLSKRHRNELFALKKQWELKSMDDVLERLISPHRPELIGFLGITVEEEHA